MSYQFWCKCNGSMDRTLGTKQLLSYATHLYSINLVIVGEWNIYYTWLFIFELLLDIHLSCVLKQFEYVLFNHKCISGRPPSILNKSPNVPDMADNASGSVFVICCQTLRILVVRNAKHVLKMQENNLSDFKQLVCVCV